MLSPWLGSPYHLGLQMLLPCLLLVLDLAPRIVLDCYGIGTMGRHYGQLEILVRWFEPVSSYIGWIVLEAIDQAKMELKASTPGLTTPCTARRFARSHAPSQL